jgi:hypothetical protein
VRQTSAWVVGKINLSNVTLIDPQAARLNAHRLSRQPSQPLEEGLRAAALSVHVTAGGVRRMEGD